MRIGSNMTMEKPALENLLDYVLQCNLRDGDALPPERKLAEALGISRRDLRGALASMEASGRVWRGVGRGIRGSGVRHQERPRACGANECDDLGDQRIVGECAFNCHQALAHCGRP